MIEAMRIGWGNMMRDSFGYQAMLRAGSMSAEQLYCDLEKSSNIGCLEKRQDSYYLIIFSVLPYRIGLMIGHLVPTNRQDFTRLQLSNHHKNIDHYT